MHIPKQDTAGIDVLSFEEALTAAQRPQADYDVSRWLYVPPTYEEYRYILGTRGVHPLICVGINPSTAEPDRLDPTLQSAQRIARFNGYDSFLMFNVYAQRATRPDDMEKNPKRMAPRREHEGVRVPAHTVPGVRLPCGRRGGSIIEKRAYLSACVADMLEIAGRQGRCPVPCRRAFQGGTSPPSAVPAGGYRTGTL